MKRIFSKFLKEAGLSIELLAKHSIKGLSIDFNRWRYSAANQDRDFGTDKVTKFEIRKWAQKAYNKSKSK